jgi:hypothetical protein
MICKYCERELCDTDCDFTDRRVENAPPRRTAKEWREQGAAMERERSRSAPPVPFTDIIRPAACGGVTITIDHPAGPLTWQLPRPRAVEFLAAFSAAMEGR